MVFPAEACRGRRPCARLHRAERNEASIGSVHELFLKHCIGSRKIPTSADGSGRVKLSWHSTHSPAQRYKKMLSHFLLFLQFENFMPVLIQVHPTAYMYPVLLAPFLHDELVERDITNHPEKTLPKF